MSLDLKSKDTDLIKNVFNTFIDKIKIDNDSIYISINLYFVDMDSGGGSGGNIYLGGLLPLILIGLDTYILYKCVTYVYF